MIIDRRRCFFLGTKNQHTLWCRDNTVRFDAFVEDMLIKITLVGEDGFADEVYDFPINKSSTLWVTSKYQMQSKQKGYECILNSRTTPIALYLVYVPHRDVLDELKETGMISGKYKCKIHTLDLGDRESKSRAVQWLKRWTERFREAV